jgi:hypothetical protein
VAKGAPTLILDIDSGSLGACLVEHIDKPLVSEVQRVPIGTGDTRDAAGLIPLLKEALTATIPTYAKLNPKIQQVSIVIASPWFASTLRTLSSKSDKPVTVSAQSIKKVVDTHRKTEHESQGKVTLEALPVTVEVNGYRTLVRHPVQGTSLAVTLYESITDQLFVRTVADAVHASLPHATITWHTTPVAYAETLLRVSDEDHATMVDVGSEVTDVVILSHQTVAFVGSIPLGSRTIQRALASGKGATLADSASRLTMFARGELAPKEMEATAAALTEAAKPWQQGFTTIMAEAGNTVPVPNRVFVVGERDELPWFTQVVTGAESRGQRPLPTTVTAEFFAGAITYGENAKYDVSLALDVLFFHMRGKGAPKVHSTALVLYSVQ